MRIRATGVLPVAAALAISLFGCDEPSDQCTGELVGEAGNQQTGAPGAPLPIPLTVYAIDCNGGTEVGLAGARAIWTATHGLVNGVVTDTLTTDASGRSTVVWTLGNLEGPQTVVVKVYYRVNSYETYAFDANAVPTCSAGATVHGTPGQGTQIDASETWGPGDHRMVGSIRFTGTSTLRIEAGATVCIDGPGLELSFDEATTLRILGTAAQPVRVSGAGNGSLRIENYTNRPVDTPVHQTITNARLEDVSIEGYNYDIDSTVVRGGWMVLEGASHFRASTADNAPVTIIAREGMSGDYEASFKQSNDAFRVMGLGGSLTFHGCEFISLPKLDITSFAAHITIEQSNFDLVGEVTSGARADSVDARNNFWSVTMGPNHGINVSGPIRTLPFRTTAAPIGYRPH